MPLTNSPSNILNVPVFAGQGSPAANSHKTRSQALLDAASSPSCSFLSASCHEAFHCELSSLSTAELNLVGVDLTDFSSRDSLLSDLPDCYSNNAVISGTMILLVRALRYLAFVESTCASNGPPVPFNDHLKGNAEHGIGILGFSSGILAACVVGTSVSTLHYISRSVEAYRLAIWIGVRTQQYRKEILTCLPSSAHSLPWSIFVLGLSREAAEQSIADFKTDVSVH